MLSRQEFSEKKEKSWFLLSYDAGEELYEETIENGKTTKKPTGIRKYSHNDFRKEIIRILRVIEVTEMDEYVETTIVFQDPSPETLAEKLNHWETEFAKIGDNNFKFIIVPIQLDENNKPIIRHRAKDELITSFTNLYKEVIKEELEATEEEKAELKKMKARIANEVRSRRN